MPMLTLLLTRPQPQAEAFAAELDRRLPGRFRPVFAPMLEIAPRPGPLELEGYAALTFTSANAVRIFTGRHPGRGLPAFCVGSSTEEAARAAGFRTRSADGDAHALARLLAAEAPGPVLHLRGAHAAADLAALIAPLRSDLPLRDQIIYDQLARPLDAATDAAGQAGRFDAVALFSPRSARLFAEAAGGWDLARTATVAISQAADLRLAALRPARRLIAGHPSREGMIAALAEMAEDVRAETP